MINTKSQLANEAHIYKHIFITELAADATLVHGLLIRLLKYRRHAWPILKGYQEIGVRKICSATLK